MEFRRLDGSGIWLLGLDDPSELPSPFGVRQPTILIVCFETFEWEICFLFVDSLYENFVDTKSFVLYRISFKQTNKKTRKEGFSGVGGVWVLGDRFGVRTA